jgi:hypothetical protein
VASPRGVRIGSLRVEVKRVTRCSTDPTFPRIVEGMAVGFKLVQFPAIPICHRRIETSIG